VYNLWNSKKIKAKCVYRLVRTKFPPQPCSLVTCKGCNSWVAAVTIIAAYLPTVALVVVVQSRRQDDRCADTLRASTSSESDNHTVNECSSLSLAVYNACSFTKPVKCSLNHAVLFTLLIYQDVVQTLLPLPRRHRAGVSLYQLRSVHDCRSLQIS
jgi:hypothetical protein